MIGNNVKISKKGACVDETAIIDDFVYIGKNVRIGKRARIYRNCVIKDNVEIKNETIIEENCIIGYDKLTRLWSEDFERKVVIGKGALVRTGCVVYTGCWIGDGSRINHNVVLRENTKVGNSTSLGCFLKCDGYTEIGNHCSIHGHTHLTSFMKIEDYVFMGPHCVTANDNRMDYKRGLKASIKGPLIRFGARIGVGVTICPGVIIGREAFVCAGSVVIRNVDDFAKVFGVPAKKIGKIPDVERLKIDGNRL